MMRERRQQVKPGEMTAETAEEVSALVAPTEEAGGKQSRFLTKHAPWIAVIFIIAITTRSLWVWYAPADPTTKNPPDDTFFYHYYAVEVMEGHGYVVPKTETATAFWPPGYSLLLAGLYRVFGAHPEVAWATNIVLGALTCVGLYVLGFLIGGRKVGVVAGLVLAVYPGHLFYASLVLSETLFTLGLVLAMCLAVLAAKAGSLRLAIATGLLIGLAALVRGQALVLIPAIALFWLLATLRWRRTFLWTILAILSAIVAISPWTIRNYFSMGDFVFLSTNDGHNLFMGNHEEADGRVRLGANSWIMDKFLDLPWEEREVESNRYALEEGLEYMWGHPGRELELAGLKMRALYADDQEALRGIADEASGKMVSNSDLLGDVANGAYFAVLGLAALGSLTWFVRPRKLIGLPVLVIVFLTMGQLLFFADPRFHFPMMPSFVLLAATAIVGAAQLCVAAARRLARLGIRGVDEVRCYT